MSMRPGFPKDRIEPSQKQRVGHKRNGSLTECQPGVTIVKFPVKSALLAALAVSMAPAFSTASSASGLDEAMVLEATRFVEATPGETGDKNASCETYARLSAAQAEANRRYACGYRGTRWDLSAQTHLSWCRYVSPELAKQEIKDRLTGLEQCLSRIDDFDDARQRLQISQN
jgi:hypothetical protein